MAPSEARESIGVGAATVRPEDDRRSGIDRRVRPTRVRDSLLQLGRSSRRRKDGRRSGDNVRTYVDRYRKRDVLLVSAILLFNLIDAGFTLHWLQRGGQEANPVMGSLLDTGHVSFLLEKAFLVGFCLIVLVVHKNFRLARAGLWLLLSVYVGLVAYHLALWLGASPLL